MKNIIKIFIFIFAFFYFIPFTQAVTVKLIGPCTDSCRFSGNDLQCNTVSTIKPSDISYYCIEVSDHCTSAGQTRTIKNEMYFNSSDGHLAEDAFATWEHKCDFSGQKIGLGWVTTAQSPWKSPRNAQTKITIVETSESASSNIISYNINPEPQDNDNTISQYRTYGGISKEGDNDIYSSNQLACGPGLAAKAINYYNSSTYTASQRYQIDTDVCGEADCESGTSPNELETWLSKQMSGFCNPDWIALDENDLRNLLKRGEPVGLILYHLTDYGSEIGKVSWLHWHQLLQYDVNGNWYILWDSDFGRQKVTRTQLMAQVDGSSNFDWTWSPQAGLLYNCWANAYLKANNCAGTDYSGSPISVDVDDPLCFNLSTSTAYGLDATDWDEDNDGRPEVAGRPISYQYKADTSKATSTKTFKGTVYGKSVPSGTSKTLEWKVIGKADGAACVSGTQCAGGKCWGSTASSFTCSSSCASDNKYANSSANCCNAWNQTTKQCFTFGSCNDSVCQANIGENCGTCANDCGFCDNDERFCTTDRQCANYCVHGRCRATQPYAGDNYCDIPIESCSSVDCINVCIPDISAPEQLIYEVIK